ncbi:DUF898 domain-containing protein [Verminephrobacter aporrectodeae subsp. tuberculatae]|uniref:DUF898 domain-containing protein n=1 Tax=Verminephrobacter aporrectodeae subsp. tuberculatae TaxID=1110392 RepID=A0ABT3KXX5_9BURK|nr:YjgN family protein [Verminephrobacter aporrectodeae]MCW5323178.1 DUF898 domain-containing protein [Verminephrobacter aporrectodeae subsp. tuberculatae]MCW8199613.1 DUF898 domain-containing protein [Verminephrobacter aporrectodeae subsp. tuberculatae]
MNQNPSDDAAQPLRSFPPQDIDTYSLEFIGSGGGYFRVWIVNLLLQCMTLGIYTPWARRRTAQYFYNHTLVAGSPLEFTGSLRKMVLGFVLLILLYLTYSIASSTGQALAVLLFFLAGAVLAPFFWRNAMRFRLNATRWRGLRWQFVASWREVYLASWPLFVLPLVCWGVVAGLLVLSPDVFETHTTSTSAIRGLLGLGLVLVAAALCYTGTDYNYKRLLVLRAQLGAERGRWKLGYMDFAKVWLVAAAMLVLGLVSLLVLLVLLVSLALFSERAKTMGLPSSLESLSPGWSVATTMLFVGISILAVILATVPARAYRDARMFQIMWNNIGLGRVARFQCRLSMVRYILLRIKNTLLALLTLGFYRPFARVSEYRMKLESVSMHVQGHVEQVADAMLRQQPGGLGDALADAAGLELFG